MLTKSNVSTPCHDTTLRLSHYFVSGALTDEVRWGFVMHLRSLRCDVRPGTPIPEGHLSHLHAPTSVTQLVCGCFYAC